MEWVQGIVNVCLFVMVLLLPFTFWRVWVGNGLNKEGTGATDRMLALEMTTVVLIGIVILLALVEGTDTALDVGIILSALGFAGTMGIARYISEGRLF